MQYVCIFVAHIKVCMSAVPSAKVDMFVCKCMYICIYVFKQNVRVCVTHGFGVRV